MNLTKTQRRRRALRRAAYDLGVGGLYFYYRYYKSHISCSSRLDTTRMDLVKAPGTLKRLLTEGKVSFKYRNQTLKTDFMILFEDEGMEFESLDELKRYLLIRKIAGI